MKLSKSSAYIVFACVYCVCLVLANTIAGKTVEFLGGVAITVGAVTVFPIVYIINDIMAEVYGYKLARFAIFTGFACNLLAVIVFQATLALPGSQFFEGQPAFEAVLGTTGRAVVASLCSYLVGSTLNAKVMQVLHDRDGKGHLMRRCVMSTLVGECVDALIFDVILFAGVMPMPNILLMALATGVAKCLYEAVVYPITRQVILWAKRLPDGPDGAGITGAIETDMAS